MAQTPLSDADQKLIESLFREQVLCEAKLDTDLSYTLVVTDFESQHPKISVNVEMSPARTILVLSGGCALHHVTSDDQHEDRRGNVVHRIRTALLETTIQQIALVASAPSTDPRRSFIDTIDQLRSAQEFVREIFGKKRQVHNFICVEFPDGRTYTLQVSTPEFHAWYNKYEQVILGRQDEALEVEGEFDLIKSGLIR